MNNDRIAIYIRLSDADEEKGKSKDESNSIINQRNLINMYLDSSQSLASAYRQEFVDDGFSGTSTDRPAFKEMIALIREGKFNVCITKDFSRFARDYIEIGDYVECLFPFLRVRYISINDNYDSNDHKGTTGGIDFALRNIVYDSYSKDLSVKVKTAKMQRIKQGRREGGSPCYGYIPDPDRKGMDIVDHEAASVVRRIYDLVLAGRTCSEIAGIFNVEGVLTPGNYYRYKNSGRRRYMRTDKNPIWNDAKVRRIVENMEYTGCLVRGRNKVIAVGSDKTYRTDESEWKIVKGVHGAIVSEEEYDRAQKLIHMGSRKKRIPRDVIMRSMVYCGYCGCHMFGPQGKTGRYKCLRCESFDREKGIKYRSPREPELEDLVYRGIQDLITLADPLNMETSKQLSERKGKISALSGRIDSLNHEKIILYEKYVAEKVDREGFLSRKKEIVGEIAALEDKIRSLKEEAEDDIHIKKSTDVCNEFRGVEKINRKMVEAFVDRIDVYEGENIQIRWKFKDILERGMTS